MSRLARNNLNTPFLHVMVQGVNKEYIFEREENIKEYLNIINRNKENYDFSIIAYCIMNNHAHFLIYTKNKQEFSMFMHKTNLLYAQMYNKQKNRVGVLFRNRYKSEPIYDMRYLISCIKYIHNNPVKARIVEKCEEYKYSSYNEYIKNGEITKSKIMKEIFGNECDFSKLFNEKFEKRFMDVDEENKELTKEFIMEGIKEYQLEYAKDLIEIFSSREIFKELIMYLNKECNIKFIEIRNYFEITRGVMDSLKIV